MHEAAIHDCNSFLTLTYDEDHLPLDRGLDVRDFQLFMKRLRKRLGETRVRYYMCGEYGDTNQRPHFHVCLFGEDFSEDRERASRSLWTSPRLSEAWSKGFAVGGELTRGSAAYVARYCTKKISPSLDAASYADKYGRWDEETGEFWAVRPEFSTMSRGGKTGRGIGSGWFAQYGQEVYPMDEVIVAGHKRRPPRYYDQLLGEKDPEQLEALKDKRRLTVDPADSTPERRRVRETVAKSRLALNKRSI